MTLYSEQWKKLLDKKDAILSFLADNDDKLKKKD